MASFACCMRLRPSKPNGLVTTPTVSAPMSLDTSATTGAAPEPVPPPIPAVTKTRSDPRTTFAISSRLSSAAALPCAGLPPAPRPRVEVFPMFSTFLAALFVSACASVFTAQNSTPSMFVSTMRFTALPPPPPTPTTLMMQGEVGFEFGNDTGALLTQRTTLWHESDTGREPRRASDRQGRAAPRAASLPLRSRGRWNAGSSEKILPVWSWWGGGW
mmetsp:Transcript_19069/g.50140  ORF Transcript_19069/g.50140 Transcript_19069/m.50140 type:complete len:216 (+) Transcript_19069:1141-1788(+)